MNGEAKAVIIFLMISVALAAFTGAVYIGYSQGRVTEKAEWVERDREATAKAAEEQRARRAELDGQRQTYEAAITIVTRNYEDRIKEKDREKTAAVTAARARGLFIDAKCPESSAGLPAAAATNGVADGSGKVRLSDAASEFLIAEASRADRLAERLTALQIEHRALYEFCRGAK